VDPAVLSFAHRLADAAGRAIRPHFRTAFQIDDKADLSPVTIADREAERVMRQLVNEVHPAHGIVGEEWGVEREDAEYVWVFDPIDGTKAFISGMPLFCTLIGLLHRGRPVMGLIDQPISGERWLGATGRRTEFNGRPAATRQLGALSRAIVYTTSLDPYSADDRLRFQRLRERTYLTRFSADAYAFGLVAIGQVDIAIESGLKLYDFAALAPVIEGAGGVMSDWSGRPLDQHSDGRVIACGGAELHRQALEVLAG